MKKKLTYKKKIQGAFNFIYAGCANVFITTSGNKYVVCCCGFTFDGINFFFGKNRYCKLKFDTIYKAIEAFNEVCNSLTSTTDWYYNEFFVKEFDDLFLEDVY